MCWRALSPLTPSFGFPIQTYHSTKTEKYKQNTTTKWEWTRLDIENCLLLSWFSYGMVCSVQQRLPKTWRCSERGERGDGRSIRSQRYEKKKQTNRGGSCLMSPNQQSDFNIIHKYTRYTIPYVLDGLAICMLHGCCCDSDCPPPSIHIYILYYLYLQNTYNMHIQPWTWQYTFIHRTHYETPKHVVGSRTGGQEQQLKRPFPWGFALLLRIVCQRES